MILMSTLGMLGQLVRSDIAYLRFRFWHFVRVGRRISHGEIGSLEFCFGGQTKKYPPIPTSHGQEIHTRVEEREGKTRRFMSPLPLLKLSEMNLQDVVNLIV